MDDLTYDVESSEFKCSALCFLFSLLFSGIDKVRKNLSEKKEGLTLFI
jgi:hypothetical protein